VHCVLCASLSSNFNDLALRLAPKNVIPHMGCRVPGGSHPRRRMLSPIWAAVSRGFPIQEMGCKRGPRPGVGPALPLAREFISEIPCDISLLLGPHKTWKLKPYRWLLCPHKTWKLKPYRWLLCPHKMETEILQLATYTSAVLYMHVT